MVLIFPFLFCMFTSLLPRQQAPFFQIKVVSDEKFQIRSLSDYEGKYLVLLFYPFDFTFVCPTEILAFSDNIKRFQELNAEILAVSTDSLHSHLHWIRTPRNQGGLGQVSYPLAADFNKKMSEDYQVLV